MDNIAESSRERFWARVVSVLLLNHNYKRFRFKELLVGGSESEEQREVRITVRLYLENTIEYADVYYKNQNGASKIDVWDDMLCNEKRDGNEMVESLKKCLEPLRNEVDGIFRVFVMRDL